MLGSMLVVRCWFSNVLLDMMFLKNKFNNSY